MEYQSRTSLTEPESFEITLTYSLEPDFINEKMGKHHTLISLITGDQLIKLREQHKYKLFDKNVRFNLGKNKINSGIVDTALKDGLGPGEKF